MKFIVSVSLLAASLGVCSAHAEPFSINDALKQAIQTNPGVGEASANRRATESEMRQTQSTLLPQVRLEANAGPERFTQNIVPPPLGSGSTMHGRYGSIVVRQLLFDGFTSINEVWRQSARVNASAYRVRERTELIALDAAEAYIDVVRYGRLVELARQNVANHQAIFNNVESRYKGGRSGEGDLQQALERVEAAKAAQYEFERSLEDARAKYRKVVGIEAFNLRFPGTLKGLPTSKDASLAVAIHHNATLQASQADTDAARHAFHATSGAFMPSVSLEGRASRGIDSDGYVGRRDDVSGRVVMSWDIFRGGQDSWRRTEMAERYNEQNMRHAKLQRDALESIDKAWSARTITVGRIAALTRQLAADRKAIDAYRKEYELGQRSLIDLLNAENQYFNAAVSLTSARGVVVFADYQLLAAMGVLLEYLKAPPPVEAAPLDQVAFGPFPTKIAPFVWKLPSTGSNPLNATGMPSAVPYTEAAGAIVNSGDRWQIWSPTPTIQNSGNPAWLEQSRSPHSADLRSSNHGSGSALSFTAAEFTDTSTSIPAWFNATARDIKTNP
ncbi:Outer membrane efflux protein BepC OS=Afipia felis OX=1035 GN=bepC_2 PE=3 SV=1 [Afipia felis]